MKTTKIMLLLVGAFIIFSIAIFLTGLNETARVTTFNITQAHVFNESFVINKTNSTQIWTQYQNFKNSYIFTNDPFIKVINFVSILFIWYYFVYCFRIGWTAPPFSLSDIFISYNIFMILVVYIGLALFNYLKNIFVTNLIIVLFNDIYIYVWGYQLLINYFVPLLLIGYILSWLGNQIKYFDQFNI